MKPSIALPAPSGKAQAAADSERFSHALQQFWLNQPGAPETGHRDTPARSEQASIHSPERPSSP
ncbi:hypothetical protein [Pseudomonas sp. MRSN 12121]|uniref:hypothetical protein n=1 Tax=Pseudomonas sp. MRSN 12121 TaxID=1611770 RepID=UPI0005BED864|nr:hypothetical protein [Pseudomonas sp. MRSN 12121]AJO80641.1 hypothetical protein TO66_26475 [Pseudomonas sp. MRSN 12121]